jgi:DNA-binding MarR family transcriptional regulator
MFDFSGYRSGIGNTDPRQFLTVINPLSPKLNQHDVAAKTLVAFDRIAEALRVRQWEIGKNYGLTPLQIKTLQFIDHQDRKEVTVSLLSDSFQMSKPTISETIRILTQKGLVAKERSQTDGRSFRLSLLDEGEAILRQISVYSVPFWEVLRQLPAALQERLFSDIYRILGDLQQEQLIPIQGMCLNCQYFSRKSNGPFCKLLEKPLKKKDLRVDCPEFVAKDGAGSFG